MADMSLIYMSIGFLLAAYSIVANDAIQTLGTFIASNKKRPWWVLFIFTSAVLTLVLIYGWISNSGDVSYGRLEKFPVPENFSFLYILPPLVVLILTRYGIPVSTTFLILSSFAPTVLSAMLAKSFIGYLVAFVLGFCIYKYVTNNIEKFFIDTKEDPKCPKKFWIALQWVSTSFLWSQWLIQDLANIFVYMPNRSIDVGQLVIGLVVLNIILAYLFYTRGGSIQKIVTSKTNTEDIRSATIIDFFYALILLVFKEYSTIPMSTTWVFIGLLAGREYGMTLYLRHKEQIVTIRIIMNDIAKATIGLLVSVVFALSFTYLLNIL